MLNGTVWAGGGHFTQCLKCCDVFVQGNNSNLIESIWRETSHLALTLSFFITAVLINLIVRSMLHLCSAPLSGRMTLMFHFPDQNSLEHGIQCVWSSMKRKIWEPLFTMLLWNQLEPTGLVFLFSFFLFCFVFLRPLFLWFLLLIFLLVVSV